jgi:hypothetical protein
MEKEAIFRIQAHRIHLTYKTHIEEEKWRKWAETRFSKIKLYSIVHENGDENNNYPHTHILVDFIEKLNIRNCHTFNYKLEENNDYWVNPYWKEYHYNREGVYLNEDIIGIHPNIQTVGKDNKYWDTVVEYHKKNPVALFTDIESDEEKKLKEEIEKKANCKKCLKIRYSKKHTCGMIEYEEEKPVKQKLGLNELRSKFEEDPNFDAISFYGGDDIRSIGTLEKALTYIKKPMRQEPETILKQWQMDLLEELTPDCENDRTIMWYHDPKGKAGKSFVAEYLEEFYGVFRIDTLDLDTVSLLLKEEYERRRTEIKRIIIDLPRNYGVQQKEYKTLELLKSGKMTSKKFFCKKFIFCENSSPHVIVFSNEAPDFKNLTDDKLGYRLIDKKGNKVKYENIIPFNKPKPINNIVAKPDPILDDYYKPFNFKFSKEERIKAKKYWDEYKEADNTNEIKKLLMARNMLSEIIKANIENDLDTIEERSECSNCSEE